MIRAAGPADAAAVAALEQDSFGVDAWSAALVAEGLSGRIPTVRYLVAEVDGTVVGYAAASLVGEVAELQRIAVDRTHRRAGLASRLLDGVVALAREDGAERVLLEVREGNAGARAFYAAAGFTEIARRRRYYADGATAVVLELALGPGGDAVDVVQVPYGR